MVMQGICSDEQVVAFADIGTMNPFFTRGGRFVTITLSGTLGASNVLTLICGGGSGDYIPTVSNMTVTIPGPAGGGAGIACLSIDMGAYTSVKIKGITGMTAGSIIFQPSWN